MKRPETAVLLGFLYCYSIAGTVFAPFNVCYIIPRGNFFPGFAYAVPFFAPTDNVKYAYGAMFTGSKPFRGQIQRKFGLALGRARFFPMPTPPPGRPAPALLLYIYGFSGFLSQILKTPSCFTPWSGVGGVCIMHPPYGRTTYEPSIGLKTSERRESQQQSGKNITECG